MAILLSDKDMAFRCLTRQAQLHIELSETRTDYQKLVLAVRRNIPALVKFYLDAGVSANLETGIDNSALFCAVVYRHPLITKMLLDYGANPGFEHKVTHETIVSSVFFDYDKCMSDGSSTNVLNDWIMIAAIIRNAGQRFDIPDSLNRSPLDKFGLFVGSERKAQVLAEFLEKIDRTDISSIQVSDIVAQSPEAITHLSPQEEHQVFLYQNARYAEILSPRRSGFFAPSNHDNLTHFSPVSGSGMFMFKPQADNLLPILVSNELKLEQNGFSEDKLASEEEKEVYNQYCCTISLKIMTDPVFDPRCPQYQFDKPQILKWLAINRQHPFTRDPLTASGLQSNLPLKQNIDKFVEETVSAWKQRVEKAIRLD